MSAPTVAIASIGYHLDGTPAVGAQVVLRPVQPIRLDDGTVLDTEQTITLNEEGALAVDVVASDANDGDPVDYHVQNLFGSYRSGYVTLLTADAPIDLFALSYMTEANPVNPQMLATQAALDEETAAREAADTTLTASVAGVAADLAAEVVAREATDTDLAAEAAARIAADTALTSAVAAKATPADISAAISALVDGAPGLMNTLLELSAALNDDPDFAATMTAALAAKADAAGLTAEIARALAAEALLAPLASPALTGNPTAPTQTAGNNTTRLATTAFVQAAITALGLGSIATHAASEYQPVNLEGTLAARPAANTVPAKSMYFATDDNGGKQYRSNGTVWTAIAPGVTELPGSSPLAEAVTTVAFTTTSTYPTYVDVTGLTGVTFTFPASGKVNVELDAGMSHSVATRGVLFQVIDGSANVLFDGSIISATNSGAAAPTPRAKTVTGTPGASLTIKVQAAAAGAGTASVGVGGIVKAGARLRVMPA